jgi:hypothetical protein
MIIHWVLPTLLRDLNREGAHPAAQLSIPQLRRILSRSDKKGAGSAWAMAAQLLSLPAFPFAQVMAVNAGLSAHQRYLLLTPTAIRPEHRGVYLLGDRPLQLSDDERSQLREALNAWLKEDGLHLEATGSEHWLLTHNHHIDVHTTPYWQVVGKDAMTVMPTGSDALFWQAKLTEWQMFLQRVHVNQQRAVNQLPQVQAIHLWGESETKLPHSTRISAVATDNEALLKWLKVCAAGFAVIHLDQLSQCQADEVLVIAGQADQAWAYGDWSAWSLYWQKIDRYFDMTVNHIIYADNESRYVYTAQRRWFFWRGNRHLPMELQ